LVTEITPNYLTLLSEGSAEADVTGGGIKLEDATLLMHCLRSVTGLNAVLSHVKALIQESKTASKDARRPDIELNLGIFLDVLAVMLREDMALTLIWDASTSKLNNAALRKTQSHSLVTLVCSGRIPSLAAEALAVGDLKDLPERIRWISDGAEFSKWAGRNIASWARCWSKQDDLRVCSDLVQRGLSLGYLGELTFLSKRDLLHFWLTDFCRHVCKSYYRPSTTSRRL
jgi:telomere length regulation protein